MKTTTEECLGIIKGIDNIKVHKMNINTAYKLLKIQNILKQVSDSYARIERGLVEECIDKEETSKLTDGKIQIKEDKIDYYFGKIKEALEEPVYIDTEKISINEFADIEISVETLGLLMPIIES